MYELHRDANANTLNIHCYRYRYQLLYRSTSS